ncbi:chorismate-binding protein [Flagellimonas amoyensis]|uniref:chorismate-binding protein n=1 Tax=Flagellimonas amoyensis TaxID=2169401 RepID=UPI000D378D7C|nr:chorismate-binding protein [Allomuricauda amoyensis]
MRTQRSYSTTSSLQSKKALLEWSKSYTDVVWLDSNGHRGNYSSFEACLAMGRSGEFSSLEGLRKHFDHQPDWLFGYFSYDLKNQLEDLDSRNVDGIGFPDLYFFQPQKIIILDGDQLQFLYLEADTDDIEKDFETIVSLMGEDDTDNSNTSPVPIKMRIHKDAYFEKANRFLEHIHRGDIYEANFCQEFYAQDVQIAPLETYKKLNSISEPPFAAYMRLGERYLMCASPERYLRKQGEKVISQPIKGTAPRGKDVAEDLHIQEKLAQDEKERAENIMITDLVRNDLSKSAIKGSVTVEELCKIYGYKQVNQMISTITSSVNPNTNPVDLITETFPMGSMTGAPKISAMKIIETLEETKRGLYSGAVGYFDPEGNFDFNVVIRSILYNEKNRFVSYSVGSAITAKSDPEMEYQECLLKARAMRSVLEEEA